MRVGKSKGANAECIRRSEVSLNHAIRKIRESGIALMSAVYIYMAAVPEKNRVLTVMLICCLSFHLTLIQKNTEML